jgi:hypothetical protein
MADQATSLFVIKHMVKPKGEKALVDCLYPGCKYLHRKSFASFVLFIGESGVSRDAPICGYQE